MSNSVSSQQGSSPQSPAQQQQGQSTPTQQQTAGQPGKPRPQIRDWASL